MPKLTKRYIDAARYEGDGSSRDVRWDDGGFGLRIYPSRRKSFVLSYRNSAGRKRMIVLGAYGLDLTLDQARDKATKERAKLVDGADPLAERHAERAETATGDTFKAVAESFVTRYVRVNKRASSAVEDERIINKDLVSKWGKRKVADIARRDVIELLDEITDRGSPIMANRTLAVVRRPFGWCVERGVIDGSPVIGVKAPGKESKRDRVLDDNELRFVWNAAGALGWPFGPFVRLLILSGQRRGEVAAMKWSNLDLDGDEPKWTLPREATKGDRAHTVPLSPQVIDIIADLPRMESAFVFDTGRRKEDTPINGFSKTKRDLDAKIAKLVEKDEMEPLSPWTLHDIRRSAASGMAALNVPPHILSRVLNHAAGAAEGITAVYNRHAYTDEQRHALNAWGAHIERIVAGKEAGNVVELRSDAQ